MFVLTKVDTGNLNYTILLRIRFIRIAACLFCLSNNAFIDIVPTTNRVGCHPTPTLDPVAEFHTFTAKITPDAVYYRYD